MRLSDIKTTSLTEAQFDEAAGEKAIGAAVSKKRRQDPNKNRKGKAKNVSNTKGK